MDLFLVPKNEPQKLESWNCFFRSGELSLLDLPSGIAIRFHYLVLFPGVSCGESKTEVLEEAKKKIPRGIQDRIPGKESRRGLQEKNPGEERNLEPSYRRGRHGRHGRLNELNELNSLIARVCKGLRWFARACKDLRTLERLCKGLQGLARRSSSCVRRKRSSCARRRKSGIQNHVWKNRVYLFILFIW